MLGTSFGFDMDIDYVEPHGINIKVFGECPFIYTLVNYDMKRHRPTVSSDAFNTWSRRVSPQHTTSEEGSPLKRLPTISVAKNVQTVIFYIHLINSHSKDKLFTVTFKKLGHILNNINNIDFVIYLVLY